MNEKRNYRIWMVRAGSGGYLLDEFLQKNIIAIGWNDLGKLPKEMTYDQLKKKFRAVYPDDSYGRVNQSVGQIWKFVKDFKEGDKIITYDSGTREYYLGEITSGYEFSNIHEYHHYRQVVWQSEPAPRDVLPTAIKNTLGSTLTIFELSNDVWLQILKYNKNKISDTEEKEIEDTIQKSERSELDRIKNDIVGQSWEFIKDIIANLSPENVEQLVAGLLRSLGYKTRFTSKGADLGTDIIASSDELALDGPQIKVQVKKRTKDKVGVEDVRNFIGSLRGHHKGIFVTTSGFTKEAKYEAERANFAITLIDSDWLVELIVSNYETLDPEIKALIPLKRIYWPV